MRRLRCPASIVAACFVLAVILLTPASAPAGFAPSSVPLSEPVGQIGATSDAVDPAGNTVAVWMQLGISPPKISVAMGRRIAADGSLGPLLSLSPPGEEGIYPTVAVAPDGAAFVAWRLNFAPNWVKGRWINADGSLGPVLTILTGSASEDGVGLRVVVDANGVATVAWYNQAAGKSDVVELRRIHPDSTQGAQVTALLNATSSFGIAALPGGATFLVSGSVTDVVDAGGAAGAPQDAHTSGTVSSLETGVAFDAQGNGLIAWRRGLEAPWALIARRVNSAGTPIGSELEIEPATQSFISAEQHVAADSNGHFLVGWFEQDAGNYGHDYVRAVNADGSFAGVAQAVSELGGGLPYVALDDRGFGLAAFSFRLVGAPHYLVLGRILGAGAAPLGAITSLSEAEQGGVVSLSNNPANGVATSVWAQTTGGEEVVMARRYLEPPTCFDTNATVLLGRPTAAPLSCSGIGVNGVRIVTAPAHGTLGAFSATGPSIMYTPTPGYRGSDSFVYQGENDGGQSANATVRIVVNGAPTTTPGALTTTPPPVVTNATQSHRVWREGRRLASFSRKHELRPVGTTFSFTLNEQASVSFAFTQRVGERKVNGKCVPQTKKNRRKRACKRTLTRGTLTFSGHIGMNKVSFQGLISRSKKLPLGSYTLLITASSVPGQRSTPRQLGFTIVK
jgi:hypothetical protein